MKNCTECNYRFTFKDRLKTSFSFRGRLKCRSCKSIYKPKVNIYRGLYYGFVTFIFMLKMPEVSISNKLWEWMLYMSILWPIYLLFDVLPHRWHRYEKIDETNKTL